MEKKPNLIDIDALIAIIRGHNRLAIHKDDIERIVNDSPTVDAVPVVHGEWIDMTEDYITGGMWRCSVCECDMYFDIMTPTECGCLYCPNCGAKLDGGVNNEQV